MSWVPSEIKMDTKLMHMYPYKVNEGPYYHMNSNTKKSGPYYIIGARINTMWHHVILYKLK